MGKKLANIKAEMAAYYASQQQLGHHDNHHLTMGYPGPYHHPNIEDQPIDYTKRPSNIVQAIHQYGGKRAYHAVAAKSGEQSPMTSHVIHMNEASSSSGKDEKSPQQQHDPSYVFYKYRKVNEHAQAVVELNHPHHHFTTQVFPHHPNATAIRYYHGPPPHMAPHHHVTYGGYPHHHVSYYQPRHHYRMPPHHVTHQPIMVRHRHNNGRTGFRKRHRYPNAQAKMKQAVAAINAQQQAQQAQGSSQTTDDSSSNHVRDIFDVITF